MTSASKKSFEIMCVWKFGWKCETDIVSQQNLTSMSHVRHRGTTYKNDMCGKRKYIYVYVTGKYHKWKKSNGKLWTYKKTLKKI